MLPRLGCQYTGPNIAHVRGSMALNECPGWALNYSKSFTFCSFGAAHCPSCTAVFSFSRCQGTWLCAQGAWKKTHRKYGISGPPLGTPGNVPLPPPAHVALPERALGRPARKIRPPARTADNEGSTSRMAKHGSSIQRGSSLDEDELSTPASRPFRRPNGVT